MTNQEETDVNEGGEGNLNNETNEEHPREIEKTDTTTGTDNLTETHDDMREKRNRIVPKRFDDIVVKLPSSIDHACPTSHQASSTVHSFTNYISYDKFSDSQKAFLAAISSNEEPRFFKQAS